MSKNVFADLGFKSGEAAEMALRVAVAVEIRKVIRQRALKQEDAKRLFGVPQPTISKIMALQVSGISVELLLRMLFKAGIPFQIASSGSCETVIATVSDFPTATVASKWNVQAAAIVPSKFGMITRVDTPALQTTSQVFVAAEA